MTILTVSMHTAQSAIYAEHTMHDKTLWVFSINIRSTSIYLFIALKALIMKTSIKRQALIK